MKVNSFVLRDGTRYSTQLLETLNYTDVSLIRQAKRTRQSRTLRINNNKNNMLLYYLKYEACFFR